MSKEDLATSMMVYTMLQSNAILHSKPSARAVTFLQCLDILMFLCEHLLVLHTVTLVYAGEGDGGQAEAVWHQ